MTDPFEDGSWKYLVRVRAQVMVRDDSTGGWLPMGGGGLSNVSVRKRVIAAEEPKHEYLIFGKRISDLSVVLSCVVKKDFVYNKVMPTFHHWKTGDKKFGLTFQTAADARAFDKGVRTAVQELVDGLCESNMKNGYNDCEADVGDDDVFMTLNLPVERGDSRSSSDSSSRGVAVAGSRHATPPTESHHHRIHYLPRRQGSDHDPSPEQSEKDNYSYVQLTAVHEYIYPVDEQKTRRDSNGSLKKRSTDLAPSSQPALPAKKHREVRYLCRHCQTMYSRDDNPKGSCEHAPDCVLRGINTVSCIACADGILYHCMADAEGDFQQHQCDCAPVDANCGRRWCMLAALSILVPCLWCYPPLRACHWCCTACGVCGGRHSPAS